MSTTITPARPARLLPPLAAVPATVTTHTDLYTLTPASPITLKAGEVYWITASSSSDIYCAFGWSKNGADPAGSIFPHVGIQRYSNGAWTDRSDDDMPQLEIDADPVAAPASIPTLSPWALLLLALGMLSIAGISRRRG